MRISEALIKLNDLLKADDIPFCYKPSIKEAISTFALSSLEKPKWIPVSERLPEEWKSVLVCYKSQGDIAQCVSERLINMDGSNRWSALGGQEPIAWMPLPAPYKAESEGNE